MEGDWLRGFMASIEDELRSGGYVFPPIPLQARLGDDYWGSLYRFLVDIWPRIDDFPREWLPPEHRGGDFDAYRARREGQSGRTGRESPIVWFRAESGSPATTSL